MIIYRVIWSLKRGPIDEPVDAFTDDYLRAKDLLAQLPRLKEMRPADVFPLETVVWRQTANGTPTIVPVDQRCA